MQEIFDGKVILVTGGTGSFGHEVVATMLARYTPDRIVVFSRDEKKQYDMRNRFSDHRLQFIIGDVRDREAVFQVMRGIDYVFHASALKQVPSCEFFPYEAVQTNVMGTRNVLDAAEACSVRKVVGLSTDKAVYPINAMGMTKALMEKMILAKARTRVSETEYCLVRYGNVMFSRGSVLPRFLEQIQRGASLTLTDPQMTRFLLPLPTAIDLVFFALAEGDNGNVLVRKAPAATVADMATAMMRIFNYEHEVQVIGMREGEKTHETLVTSEELMKAVSLENYFMIRSLDTIDYDKYFTDGESSSGATEAYTSENTTRLSVQDTMDLLLTLDAVKTELT